MQGLDDGRAMLDAIAESPPNRKRSLISKMSDPVTQLLLPYDFLVVFDLTP
jgi:hypothetical protein